MPFRSRWKLTQRVSQALSNSTSLNCLYAAAASLASRLKKSSKSMNGAVSRYVYYRCTQSRNFDCPQAYIREEKLAEAFVRLLAKVTIEEIEAKEGLRVELDRFRRLSSAVLGFNDSEGQPKISLHNFAKYILTEGTRSEKRDLIACLNQTIYLKDKELITQI